MKRNMRSLLILALVAVTSAATATLAQRAGAERPAVAGDFVKVGTNYFRLSLIQYVAYEGDQITISTGGRSGSCSPEESREIIRALGLPPLGGGRGRP